MGKIFKNSIIGGFNKKQVIAYIDNLMKKHEGDLSLAKTKHDKLKEELDKQTELYGEFEAKNAEMSARIDEQMAENEKLARENKAMKAELADIGTKYANIQAKIADIEAEAKKKASRSLVAKISSKIEENPQIAHELDVVEKKTDEIWDNFKAKLADITQDFNSIMNSIGGVEKSDTPEKAEKKLTSIKEILERVRKIGEKI